tara:strand:+ start:316 stop:735 length:420 start_codon:yes stop_codon:yes gene_type:complete
MSDKNITISYNIDESELETEAARFLEMSISNLKLLAEQLPTNTDKTLSFQTLECVQYVREQLSYCDRLFSNVENITSQYLQHKSATTFQTANSGPVEEPTEQQTYTEEEVYNQIKSNLNSPYDQQRKLARELVKNENSS